MIDYKGMKLPANVFEEFQSGNNVMGLFIEDGMINGRTIRTTKYDLNLISNMVADSIDGNSDRKIVILSKDGQVLFSPDINLCTVSTDENGYITVKTENDIKVIHSVNDEFIKGNSVDDVNKGYNKLVEMNFIYPDPDFGENGFSKSLKRL